MDSAVSLAESVATLSAAMERLRQETARALDDAVAVLAEAEAKVLEGGDGLDKDEADPLVAAADSIDDIRRSIHVLRLQPGGLA